MIKMKRVITLLLLGSLSLAGAAQALTDTYPASGTWTAPAGVTSVTVEVWGGGGAGGGNPTTSDGGGGGGGGAYSKNTAIAVTPGNTYTVTVGAGGLAATDVAGGAGTDSWFATAGTILAKGGAGGVPATTAGGAGGAGGAAASGIGTTKFSGGNGGTGNNSNQGRGGPGGSSAGTAANGTSGPVTWTTATAAVPPAGGGIGGYGGNANWEDGFAPASGNGGGGGGGAERNTAGGNGAGGKVAITYTLPSVISINCVGSCVTNASSVSWTVTLSASVTGVNSGNFTLVNAGLGGALAITGVSGSGTTWTVTASTGTGAGTLGLDMVNSTGVSTGLSNLSFTGQVYSVRLPVSVTASPTLCVNDASIGVATGNWTGLTNVATQNNVYAQASVANSDITNYLKCTGYGFSIPAGATITGISVGPWLNATWTMRDNAMQLVKGGAIQATNLATGATIPNGGGAFAATPTQFIYGSSSNLWGNTWTVANINSANFGAAFAAQRGGFASTQQAGVDAMPITINYTLPAFPTVVSINRASTDPTTPATAVSWTITFSASVTGVDATDFALVPGGGVTGAAITSVTGSGTTWTVTADTGSGHGTLGLNLVDDDSIVDGGGKQLGGTGVGNGNFTGQIYTVSPLLTCISDSFTGADNSAPDSANWSVNNVSGSFTPVIFGNRLRITDISGSAATRVTNKNLFPFGNNLVVAEFDYWAYGGSGADGIAITFSDPDNPTPGANNPPTTGGFGGSLGYANRNGAGCDVPGFTGGWIGVGIDEYGNYSNPTECRNGGPGSRPNAVSIRGSGSGATSPSASNYAYLTGTAALGANGVSSGTGVTAYRYRITLDSITDPAKVIVKVDQDKTGTGYVPQFSYDLKPLITGGTQAPLPPRLQFTYTGSTGGSTNYHEVDNLQICAAAVILASGPDHLEIDHPSGTGLTCTPSTLTIKACADAACTTTYTGGVSGTLSATGSPTVNWSGGSGFSIPAGSSTVSKNVQVTTPGSVVFNAVSTPAAASATTCNFGAPGCTFAASDTGLLISAPNHVAETTAALTVQAVKKADNSLACVPAFANTAKTVNLKCAYSNPATGTLPVRVSGTALNAAANAAAACDATGANVSLNFDATGTATPSLQYADVGQMNLTASYTGAAGALDAGLSMTGAASFIAAPASFAFTNLPAGPTLKSGNPFSVTVSALNDAGAVSPNFGKESVPGPAGVTLTSNLVTPDPVTYPSAVNPAPGNNVIAGTEFGAGGMVSDANGVATVNNLNWGEVGSITLTADLTSGSYLGSGLTVAGTSATVGAFIPDHFDTAVVPTVTLPMPCPTGLTCPALYDGFVYSGQAFRMQVIARNLAGGTTTNYSSVYGLANSVAMSAWDALGSLVAPTGAGVLANGTLASAAFVSGVGLTYTQAYTFASSPTAPSDIFLRAVDTVNTTVTSRRAVPANSVEGGVKVVSGKVTISNAHGSELLPLSLTATVQYWNNTDWVTSTTDDVTQFNTNLSTSGGNIVANILAGLGGGLSVATPGDVTVTGGVKDNAIDLNNDFTLNAPLLPGSSDISLNVPDYLLAGSNGAGINPSEAGRVTFGIFKGSENIIYIRESY